MISLNNVNIIGMTGEPIVRDVGSKVKAVLPVTLGREYQGKSYYDDIDVEAWGKTAEYIRDHLPKDSIVLVEGNLSTSKWTDNDGKRQRRTFVSCRRLTTIRYPDRVEPRAEESSNPDRNTATRRGEDRRRHIDDSESPPQVDF